MPPVDGDAHLQAAGAMSGQERHGSNIAHALRASLDSAGVSTGPVIRSIHQHGHVGQSMNGRAVVGLVQRYGRARIEAVWLASSAVDCGYALSGHRSTVTEEADNEGPLVVKITAEIVTYALYFAWLSILAGGALYLGFPPLTAIENAVEGSWHGTAAAIAVGALSIAAMRLIYDALRARVSPQSGPASTPPPQTKTALVEPKPAAQRSKKKGKKRKKRKKR